MKIAITGAQGLLGWHALAHMHADNCNAEFNGKQPPFELVAIDHATFSDPTALAASLDGVEAVLHFAGVNRGEEVVVARANPEIAEKLISACQAAGIIPHIAYANSTHSARDTTYGNSKRMAGELLSTFANKYTDLVLPHIFGECAKPYYNNVTATLIDKIWKNEEPEINPEGRVQLLHAGSAVRLAIDAVVEGTQGQLMPSGSEMSITDLYEKLCGFHELYPKNIFPDVSDPLDLALFNCYRAGAFPDNYPITLKTNDDHRGSLFETAKSLNESQSFISSTLPGKRRGDHFHLSLIERFLVVKGNALIRIRRVLTNEIHEFHVSGDEPVAIDMPTLHTHNITNIGDEDVVTFFWSHRLFDPTNPDTFADPVEKD